MKKIISTVVGFLALSFSAKAQEELSIEKQLVRNRWSNLRNSKN